MGSIFYILIVVFCGAMFSQVGFWYHGNAGAITVFLLYCLVVAIFLWIFPFVFLSQEHIKHPKNLLDKRLKRAKSVSRLLASGGVEIYLSSDTNLKILHLKPLLGASMVILNERFAHEMGDDEISSIIIAHQSMRSKNLLELDGVILASPFVLQSFGIWVKKHNWLKLFWYPVFMMVNSALKLLGGMSSVNKTFVKNIERTRPLFNNSRLPEEVLGRIS